MTDLKTFRALHDGPGAFVIPNPWDVGSARLLSSMGFKALATTSAGYAFSRGLPDGGVDFENMIGHCRELVAATDLPVSADLENGKGDSPESAGETVFAAGKVGLAGCSIEDYSNDPARPIYEFELAVERVAAAVEAARALDRDFVFTARAENLLRGINDLDDTIRRLQAFEKAGADVLYAPGIRDIETVRTICQAVSKPVNILAQPHFTLAELSEAGARRVSLGSKLTTAVFGALRAAASEILEKGTFGFVAGEMPFGELQTLFGNHPTKSVG
ncbi:isocitrate lyase/phosphoenolpyruvate mutase family protein [Chelativorans sp. ZYF759]|uniref:isocitrate lyase/PEP mutase family protein n=1 Tax=Chelativorans sp. ZYF759 TaxID=2692213 RepID=UPI00145EC870|nr:isocitrate lyase/phosphoenolpyruvate mutase family protein [Chelativorans sp. ZYF759]NMG40473.1 isocitrate lyase/phosphoenolpyruvate mutase family protein [Chelativorans sp. ZYF759]